MYQQFEIVVENTICKGNVSFYAKSVEENGSPPSFLRRKGWQMHAKTPKNYELREAKGIDDSLRSRLPDLNITPAITTSNHVIVGKWYCPFMFIKDGSLSEQAKNSTFYEMTLEQKWERVFERVNELNDEGDVVYVNAAFRSEAVFVGENRVEAIWDEGNVVDGVMWFKCLGGENEREESVGLNMAIVERMRWEEEKVGWVGGGEKTVKSEVKYEGIDGWKRFGCYVLVERFVLKRMDGSLVLTYDFGHTHQIKSIFE